jgi:hypothetical protein
MEDSRPNPDALLARVKAEESRSGHGKLKIFFGYAAGVGKTYAMLQAARREKAAGTDVVVGYVEPHGRRETETLLQGLETIPPREAPYRGVTLENSTSIERWPAGRSSFWSMSWRIQMSKPRAMPSAGRMSKSCSTLASMFGPR